MGMRMSFSFLAEVINRFTTTYTRMAVRQAITGQMKDFDRTLQQLMEHFSNPSADKIHRAKQEIESVKQVMLTNIDLVLKRNADIEELSMPRNSSPTPRLRAGCRRRPSRRRWCGRTA